MGNFSLLGLATADFSIASLSLELSITGGVIVGLIGLFILLIIAGFLVFKLINKFSKDEDKDDEEDRIIGENTGIAQIKIDK